MQAQGSGWFGTTLRAMVIVLALGWAANAPAQCGGDCGGDGTVTVDEILTMINISLEVSNPSACPIYSTVHIDDIIAAINNLLGGCAVTTSPTATATNSGVPPTATPSFAPTVSTATATITGTPATGVPTPAGQGVKAAVTSASVAADGTITATFSLTDESGAALTPLLSAAQNAQQARLRFAVAHVESYSGGGEFHDQFTRYVNDVNRTRPAYDSGGTLATVDAARGIYTYTFKTKLPGAVNSSDTYSIGVQVDRTVNGQQRSANPIFDFVPAGGTPHIIAGVTTEQCNSCHNPLIAHGNRREVRLCTLCHTQQATDEKGTSIALESMIHKLHRGKELPSVADGPAGAKYAIYSSFARADVVFAEKHDDGSVTGVGFPRAIENCAVCHTGGATPEYHKQRPSALACASCHDDVNPSNVETAAGPAGTNHFQGRGFEDGDCSFCHVADDGKEFDISVVGAHVVPLRSTQLAGLNVHITGITNHAAGQAPTIAFKVTDNAGTALTSLSGLNRLGFTFSGPTTDYTAMIALTAAGGGATGVLSGPDADGIFTYTPSSPLPADASGTWAVGTEARRNVTLATVDPIEPKTVTEAAPNEVVTFSTDGSTALMRRAVVEDQRCAECHGEFSKDFSVHGGLRNQTEYCVLCHNPNQSDGARRRRDPAAVAAGEHTETIDFKVLIHKIHTGEELNQKPYIIYGFGAAPLNYSKIDFSDVLFPGDRRDCQTCHLPNTYLLPPYPGTALGTRSAHLDPATGNEVTDGVIPPITSACTSCHDSESALAHADTQTARNGDEACLVCHSQGRDVPVSSAHAGRN